MQPKLTVQERLKDLRVVDFDLTLEELAERTGLSRSALGKYESDENAKDISPFAILTLAKFYGVSTDYLLGLTENKNHPNTELNALHLSDDAITVLTTGNFNHRLLSEMICHKDFQRMMLDAEIYVDRIADMRITNMNAAMEAVRQSVIKKKGNNEEDLYLRTLELAQVQEDEYFGHVVSKDLTSILHDIRVRTVRTQPLRTRIALLWKCRNNYRMLWTTKAAPKKRKPVCSSPTLALTTMHLLWSSLQI